MGISKAEVRRGASVSICGCGAGSAVGQKKMTGSGALSLRRPSDQQPSNDQRQSSQKGSYESLSGA